MPSNRLVKPGSQPPPEPPDDSSEQEEQPEEQPEPDEESAPIGRWGQMFLASLKKNDPAQYQELETLGELEKVARSTNETAAQEYQGTLNKLLSSEPAKKKGAERTAQVDRLRRQAEEIVALSVTVPTPEWKQQQAEGYTDQNTETWDESPLLPKPERQPG